MGDRGWWLVVSSWRLVVLGGEPFLIGCVCGDHFLFPILKGWCAMRSHDHNDEHSFQAHA